MAGGKLGCEDCDASGRCFDCKQCFGLCTGARPMPSPPLKVPTSTDSAARSARAAGARHPRWVGERHRHVSLALTARQAAGNVWGGAADFCAACGFEGAPGFDPDSEPAPAPAHVAPNHTAPALR